mmetsp:Transcript_29205/g.93166  ORF Transcript_29205/g.93166 Transcript_29205/m.93166 type:complete len:233 (+) Transcript_29205:420-1118(+)
MVTASVGLSRFQRPPVPSITKMSSRLRRSRRTSGMHERRPPVAPSTASLNSELPKKRVSLPGGLANGGPPAPSAGSTHAGATSSLGVALVMAASGSTWSAVISTARKRGSGKPLLDASLPCSGASNPGIAGGHETMLATWLPGLRSNGLARFTAGLPTIPGVGPGPAAPSPHAATGAGGFAASRPSTALESPTQATWSSPSRSRAALSVPPLTDVSMTWHVVAISPADTKAW